MSKVFVLDTKKRPLVPTHPARARQLLKKGKAAVLRKYPFTIILKREIKEVGNQPFRLKIDPGSKTTGLAILNDNTGEVVWAAELQHRGLQIKKSLEKRRAIRRSRRQRKTRYREPRFSNRTPKKGWLPPSLMSRVYNIKTWVTRLRKHCPIKAISLELVRFDTQAMQKKEISGVFYQQGTLLGYEVREYLLEKFGRKCVYCGKEDIKDLEVEHIIPKTRGGSNRISNLTLACQKCNSKKGIKTAEEFGHPAVQEQAKHPLKDAAAVNATRWKIYQRLQTTGLPIEVGTGGRTKYNRMTCALASSPPFPPVDGGVGGDLSLITACFVPCARQLRLLIRDKMSTTHKQMSTTHTKIKKSLKKTHWLDAACVGESTPETLMVDGIQPLRIVATGRGSRQMCRMDAFGFPRTKAKQCKRVHGFQTGDMVKAVVKEGRHTGSYIGKVSVRTSGSFNITTVNGTVQGISYKSLKLLHRHDGYIYPVTNLDCI